MVYFQFNKQIYIAKRSFCGEKKVHLFNILHTLLSLLPLDLTWQSLPRGNLRRLLVRSNFVIFVERGSLHHRWISALKHSPNGATRFPRISRINRLLTPQGMLRLRVPQRDTTNRCATNSRSASEMMYHSRVTRWDTTDPWCRFSTIEKSRGAEDIYRESSRSMRAEARSARGGCAGDLDAVGIMAVAGAAGQTTGSGGLVGGAIAPGTAAGWCPGRPLGRVRAIRAALPLDDALLGGPLRTAAVRVRRAGRAGVGVRIAVLLLGGPHPGFRIVTDQIVARRLRIRG